MNSLEDITQRHIPKDDLDSSVKHLNREPSKDLDDIVSNNSLGAVNR